MTPSVKSVKRGDGMEGPAGRQWGIRREVACDRCRARTGGQHTQQREGRWERGVAGTEAPSGSARSFQERSCGEEEVQWRTDSPREHSQPSQERLFVLKERFLCHFVAHGPGQWPQVWLF